ncbi:hypothetical protein [Variovorax guangxiensis]|uniref:hypothetical protein n=1 Tax=Variovorax guangxiensis TaxID=1775474 RepID=UPI002865F36D|nr:hypothetical protein [Variovorax guangxiensis]MDR6859851.1 hypothetical protein [Variovorax guangxiensis]
MDESAGTGAARLAQLEQVRRRRHHWSDGTISSTRQTGCSPKTCVDSAAVDAETFKRDLLTLAATLGTTMRTRTPSVVDELVPVSEREAQPRSLSVEEISYEPEYGND